MIDRQHRCQLDDHILRAAAEQKMRDGAFPGTVAKWVTASSDTPITKDILKRHRRAMGLPELAPGSSALGQKPIPPEPHLAITPPPAEPAPPPPPAPRPSEKLARPITDADIEQAMMKRLYDSVDQIEPGKLVELMIEREKSKQKAVPGRGKEPPNEGDPARALAARIGMAVGARPTKTGVRMRRVK